MKSIFALLFSVSLSFALLSLTGCADKCKNVFCQNGGTCVDGDCGCQPGFGGTRCQNVTNACIAYGCENGTCVQGTCVCDAGWEGQACDTRSTTRFVGNYSVAELCGPGSSNFSCAISEDATIIPQLEFDNFNDLTTGGATTKVTATVGGTNFFDIPAQTINGLEISGTGTLDENTGEITVTFTRSDGVNTDNCSATFTPQ